MSFLRLLSPDSISFFVVMFKLLFLTIFVLLMACFSKQEKPNVKFMKRVKELAGLDSSFQTKIQIQPHRREYGSIYSGTLTDSFKIINTGDKDFIIDTITAHCSCIKLKDEKYISRILPKDSITISFTMNSQKKGLISQSIVVMGNCPKGNETFFLNAIIH